MLRFHHPPAKPEWNPKQNELAFDIRDRKLTDTDIEEIALKFGFDFPAVKAVVEVETLGGGFLSDGRPKILFEGHVFWWHLKEVPLKPQNFLPANRDILYEKWTKQFYKGGEGEYERLNRAMELHRESALKSTSWGIGQIMGFNYKRCGYDTVFAFVEDMYLDEDHQFIAMMRFISHSLVMSYALKNHHWRDFARLYNGPAYEVNRYHIKLEEAFNKWS